jgi:hypothetical protein
MLCNHKPFTFIPFRHVLIVPKGAFYHRNVRPSVSMPAKLPLGGFKLNFVLGTNIKIGLENPNLVKIRQKYRQLYTFLLKLEILKRYERALLD